jgi:hypothetical protein
VKVRGLDGKEYRLSLAGKVASAADRRPRSQNHLLARDLLKKLYPFDPPHEEVELPGCGARLVMDFLLPQRKLAVEVQGRQHREFVPHFHGSPKKFLEQRSRDRLKGEWCDANGFVLVELNDDDHGDWGRAIANAFAARVAGTAAPEVG